ncbi:MAG: substrate-binding domain-containing protein [Acidobacteriota bacterium]
MGEKVLSRLAAVRKARGVGAAELAAQVGVSRQTIYAIEGGNYVPNTEVALKLARALEAGVEQLFELEGWAGREAALIETEILSTGPVSKGQAVRLCMVGERVVSVPVDARPSFLPEADGIVGRVARKRAGVLSLAAEASGGRKLVLAGCDPAIGIVGRMAEKLAGVEVVPVAASSRQALEWLREGKVHVAGSHLEDAATGEFNLPYLREHYAGEDFAVVSFARWEEGLVTAPGNPLEIGGIGDLGRKEVRFVNREAGSGSRALLERLLREAGMSGRDLNGYERQGKGHLAVAYLVRTGEAVCCLATRSAAQSFGLDFVPLRSERYDFVMRRGEMGAPGVERFLELLQRAVLRRRLEVLAGYDTRETGRQLA